MNGLTKAQTLHDLEKKKKSFKIEPLLFFTVVEWKNNKGTIVKAIKKKFSKKIVVRSSSIGEDTNNSSMAGSFKSILNVSSQNEEEIEKAVKEVVNSYHEKKVGNACDQVLIQSQTEDVKTSGVVFTKGHENGSPYYYINYDDVTGSTETVTSGLESKSIKIIRGFKVPDTSHFKKLLSVVDEIEHLFSCDKLDIEFAITNSGEIIIFQVRPLVLEKSNIADKVVFDVLDKEIQNFEKINRPLKGIAGKRTIFADMPDWNPAEIIGDRPAYLDFSLYDYVITGKEWAVARHTQGYYDMGEKQLVKRIANKPYVDVRLSFNSFIPKKIKKDLHEKLVSYYLFRLSKNHELQDKVEFDVVFTCFDFSFDSRSLGLKDFGCTEKEISDLKEALRSLTNSLVVNAKKSIKEDLDSAKSLKKIRESIKFDPENDVALQALKYAKILLDECKKKGTVQFSRLARLGFIAKILLKSLVDKKVITVGEFDSFFESIDTVATILTKDFDKVIKKRMSKESFLKKYAHLRPGTYDITSKRYGKNPEVLGSETNISFGSKRSVRKSFSSKTLKKISEVLKEEGLDFSAKELLVFAHEATKGRELAKFEFTKNLSDALELIAIAGFEMGFSRKDLSYLGVSDLFGDLSSRRKVARRWMEKINQRMKEEEIYSRIELPPIVIDSSDLKVIKEYGSKPNFITNKKIDAKTIFLKNQNAKSMSLKDRVVLIENGDPGYDWIFTKGIAGLITKYGGVASHMSIRCAEFGLPAAIGAGELFDKIENDKKIVLDCKSKKVMQ